MQAAQTKTAHTINSLRAISELSIYAGKTTATSARTPERGETRTRAEAWARRARHANGFGDAGF